MPISISPEVHRQRKVEQATILKPKSLSGESRIQISKARSEKKITQNDLNIQTPNSPSGLACKLEIINNTSQYPSITLYSSNSAGNSIPQNSASMTVLLIKSFYNLM